MKQLNKFGQYGKELFQTYCLFFKSAPFTAMVVFFLAPLQALIPLVAVAAGQKVIDQASSHNSFMLMLSLIHI